MERFVVTKIMEDQYRVHDASTWDCIADYDREEDAVAHAKRAQKSYTAEMKKRFGRVEG